MEQLNLSPFPALTTERLYLRQLSDKDGNDIFAIRSNKEVNRYLLRPLCQKIEEAKAFIEKINNNIAKNENIYWGIVTKNDNKLIGSICIWNISVENQRGEIGFELHPSCQGKGFMQEALKAVLDFAFTKLKFHSIAGEVSPENTASIKLMERNGFVREAYFKENVFHEGKFIDTSIYTLLNNSK